MRKPHDDSKAYLTAFVQDSTLTLLIEMSLRSWLVVGMVPGVHREPRKKIAPNPEVLLSNCCPFQHCIFLSRCSRIWLRWRPSREGLAPAWEGGTRNFAR